MSKILPETAKEEREMLVKMLKGRFEIMKMEYQLSGYENINQMDCDLIPDKYLKRGQLKELQQIIYILSGERIQ